MEAETFFHIASWILLGGVIIMRVYFSYQVRRVGERLMPDRQAVNREGRTMFAIRALMFLLIIAWLVLYAVDLPWMDALFISFPNWLRWVGFVLGLVSLGFWIWTQVALGKDWSPQLQLREGHRLVTTGPYAQIRHPLYAAMIGYGTGLALVTANWVFAVLTILMIVGLSARAPREEQMMLEEFGEEYREYMQKTGRFFPK